MHASSKQIQEFKSLFDDLFAEMLMTYFLAYLAYA